ncbi:hypothetical protein N7490_006047 [Penicillium lividum]|nr:hypothetical protein N7490_006047 [Penicillium lividum]
MEFRALARGLRARPTPWLLNTPRIQHPNFLTTLRYNSSSSSPQVPTIPPTTQATTKESSPSAQPTPTPEAQTETTKTAASDFDDILNKLELGPRPADGTQRTSIRNTRIADTISGTMFPSPSRDGVAGQLASRKTELKLGPTLGRQIHVEPERGVDLPAAIRMLEMTCSANKIKQQSIEQKFHVRKGMKRKELRRTRWRKLFKFSFNETVKKIQRMQAQGW